MKHAVAAARALLLLVMLAVTGAAAACAAQTPPTETGPVATTGAPITGIPMMGSVPTAPGDYRLGIADKVRVIVYNEPQLSGEFTVAASGDISAPLIGDVKAAGRTTTEVKQEMEARLGAGYLRNPNVSIDVLTFRPFFILGEVTKPGEYPYAAGLTVLNAVATAQGFTYRANHKRVFIKHAGEAEEHAMPLTSDLLVAPGDTIRVGERFF